MTAIFLRGFFKNKLLTLVPRRYISRTNINVINSVLPNIEIPDMTIPEFIYQKFNNYPNKIAVECGLTGKKLTFEDVRIKSRNLNKNLRKNLKLKQGDVIGIMLPNIPEFAVCILGALEAGLVVTAVNPLYQPGEIQKQLVDANVKAVITLIPFYPTVTAAIKQIPNKIPILTIKMKESDQTPHGAINFEEFIQTKCDIEDIKGQCLNDIVLLPYSSGTTGLPKGVQLLQKNILANLMQLNQPLMRTTVDTSDNHQDILPGVLPFFHMYGTMALLHYIYNLTKIISLPKFAPELYVSTLTKHKPNILLVVPPIVTFLSNHSSVKKEYLDSVRLILSGAAPLGKLDEEELLKKAEKDIDILQGYGLTETSPCALMSIVSRKRKFKVTGSVGEPVSNTCVKIVPIDNPFGEPLGPNQPGELLIKGPQVMKGYHNRLKETKEIFIDDWLRTGDIMYYDSNKMFYITDRLKELIKVKGFQVAPAELEEIIRNHPDITDAGVIGIPDSQYGEVPRAYVVFKPNSTTSVEKLQEYVNNQITSYKHLKGGIVVVDSIPKNASGKIMRRDLKLMYEMETN